MLAEELATMGFAVTGVDLDESEEEVVELMLSVAAGKTNEEALAGWIRTQMIIPKQE